jgi:hypothetical protein
MPYHDQPIQLNHLLLLSVSSLLGYLSTYRLSNGKAHFVEQYAKEFMVFLFDRMFLLKKFSNQRYQNQVRKDINQNLLNLSMQDLQL